MNDLKAYILFPNAAKNPLYSGWMDSLSLPAQIVREYDTNWLPPDDAGIVITHNHYRWEELSILRRVVAETNVPVLTLVDGILEYRNTFEHPDLADGSMLQPAIGHKIACIGASQVRWLESLGNVGKCELVGLPRFDSLMGKAKQLPTSDGPFRLLVTTARTPWFNDKQRDETHQAMNALKSALEAGGFTDRPVQVTWRMAEELHLNLKVPGYVNRPGPIHEVFSNVDALVTSPSTLQLEAAAYGLPVAVLDFHNAPQMTPMAWTISHQDQVASVLSELTNPSPAKRFAQDALLGDSLQQVEPAEPRMAKLVHVMVEAGVAARSKKAAIELPGRILHHPCDGFATEQASAERAKLFPDNKVFADESVEHLRTELAAAIHEMGNYPQKFFDQRTANLKMRSYINWLRLLVRNRAGTIEELTEVLQKLRLQESDRTVTKD